jgi:hypothetical protein
MPSAAPAAAAPAAAAEEAPAEVRNVLFFPPPTWLIYSSTGEAEGEDDLQRQA